MKKEEVLSIVVENIKDYIEIHQITPYKLSKLTNIQDNLVYALLQNKRNDIRLSSICIYAEAMGVLPADLLTPHFFKKD